MTVSRGANPDFSGNELLYQLEISKATLILVHPEFLQIAFAAAKSAGIDPDRVILFDVLGSATLNTGHATVSQLVEQGLSREVTFVEPKIDSKTKLAFLSFSSGMSLGYYCNLVQSQDMNFFPGTTGKPKGSLICDTILLNYY